MSSGDKSNQMYKILGLCNPLLDISANVEKSLLDKYELKANDAIMASEKHKDLIEVIVSSYAVDYTAGGAGQNVMRVAAGILKKQAVEAQVMFSGCIGKDKYGKTLESRARADGVVTNYDYAEDKTPTGTCAVMLTDGGKNRSMCAFLGASQKFSEQHLIDNWKELIEETNIIYMTGFLIPVIPKAFDLLGKHIATQSDSATGEMHRFMLNLSAPYVSDVFGKDLENAVKYADVIFGNDDEAKAYANYKGWKETDICKIASLIVAEEKVRTSVPRLVVITQGAGPVIVAEVNKDVRLIECEQLTEKEIVDTNGAGDSFCGGFISQYIQNKSIDESVKIGSFAAREIIKVSGIVIPDFANLQC